MGDVQDIKVGIDLGTTNTLACYEKKGKPEMVKFPGSGKLLPSVLFVDDTGKVLVGERARKIGILEPQYQIRSSKTFMGDFTKKWNCNGKTFTPTQVATEILREVKKGIIKRSKCGDNANIGAVITVPAYFTSNQMDETRKAGIAAGFQVLQIISEPMAAAIAAVKELDLDKKILVVDLGGGTFDLSVLEPDQLTHSYKALGVDGDRHLGGDDFDRKLYEYCIRIIEDDLGIDLSDQKKSGLAHNDYYSMVGRVREAAEQAKIELSDELDTDIDIPNLFVYNGKQYDFAINLTRDEFDNICSDLYDKVFSRIRRFISNSRKFAIDDIGTIILAGGSCYIPRISQEVEAIFHQSPDTQMDRSTLVVVGAYFVANSELENNDFHDIISHSLGVEVLDDDSHQLVLSKLLHRGEEYPCSHTKDYTTTVDNQTQVSINVYEAGSDYEEVEELGDYHDFYGSLLLEDIAPAPAGKPTIAVTFSYDESRCLTVSAKDKDTGKSEKVVMRKGEKSKPQQEAVDFMLLLDSSGSMSSGDALPQAKEACYALFDTMIDFSIHRMGLIVFESEAYQLSGLTQNPEVLKDHVRQLEAGGGTNMLSALRLADNEFHAHKNTPVIIVVTDGDPFYESETLQYAAKLKNSGVRIISIGVGKSIRIGFLKCLSSDHDSYKINTMSELRDTFDEVANKLGVK